MKLLELHILQSYPVTCLNRDDANIPKTAQFGGVTRSRISSQCLKRATREFALSARSDLFGGKRTKYVIDEIVGELGEFGESEAQRYEMARAASSAFGVFDETELAKNDKYRIKTLYYLSPGEAHAVAEAIKTVDQDATWKVLAEAKAAMEKMEADENADSDKKTQAKEKVKIARSKYEKAFGVAAKKVLKELQKSGEGLKDAVDIALFGRMVAGNTDVQVDGASQFSHALSTHEAEPQQDFYSALDDTLRERKENMEEDAHAGSGMLGMLEFTTATYYRYVGINLDQLFNPERGYLRHLDEEDQKAAVESIIDAVAQSIPNARKNGMNGSVPPAWMLGCYRSKGQPVQLVNAFERPVRSARGEGSSGFIDPSVNALLSHLEEMKKFWGVEYDCEVATGYHKNADGPNRIPVAEFVKTLTNAAFES